MSFIEDELKVQQIMGNVISYFIRIGFDDMSITTQSLASSMSDNVNQMEAMECLH